MKLCERSTTWPAVSDELVISGGGSTAVGTESLFWTANRLDRGRDELAGCIAQLAAIPRSVTKGLLRPISSPSSMLVVENSIDEAAALLKRSAQRSGQLAGSLRAAAERYGVAERFATHASQSLSAAVGYSLGFFGSIIWPFLLPGIAVLAGGMVLTSVLAPKQLSSARKSMADWLNGNRELLSDPVVVEMIRLAVMSADDVGLGILHLDPISTTLLGDSALGVFGLDAASRFMLLGAATAGLFIDAPVIVAARTQKDVSAARGAFDRADNIPGSDVGDPQIRIDRIIEQGQPDRFEVYLGGTIDFSPRATGEPFDLTSDLSGIAGEDSAAYCAAKEAMHQAGIDGSSKVVFNGYSLGGLVAARLAASGDFNAQGLYTLGGPDGQVSVPGTIPWVAVQHSDDLVPALGGTWANPDAVLVERQVYGGRAVDTTPGIPAHQLSTYRETSRLIDDATEDRLFSTLGKLNEFDRGADQIVSTYYRADRVIADRVIADRVIADRVIADRVIADRVIGDRVGSSAPPG